MVLFGIALRKESIGITFSVKIRRWEKTFYLKKLQLPQPVKAPEMDYPSMLTEKPDVHWMEPEEMDKEPEPIKLIEPEDM